MKHHGERQPVSTLDLMRERYAEKKVLTFAQNAMEEAKADKWRAAGHDHSDWNRHMAAYYGLDTINVNPFVQRPRENRLFRSIEMQRYVLLDHVANPEFLARNENDRIEAQMWTDSMLFVKDASNYTEAQHGRIHNMLIFGTGPMKTVWDPDAFGGLGMVSYSAEDPRTLFISPGANNIDEAAYVISLSLADVDEAIARFPAREKEIWKSFNNMHSNAGSGLFGKLGQYIKQKGVFTQHSGRTTDKDTSRMVEVAEMYARVPRSTSLSMTEDELGNDREILREVRMFHIINGDVLVQKDPEEQRLPYDHGEIPYTLTQNRFFPGRPWGVGDIAIVESLQQELNRLADKRSAYNEISYFPWILNPEQTGLTDDHFIQSPNGILHIKNMEATDRLRYLVPPPVGRHVQFRRDEILREIDDILGNFSVSSDVLQRNLQPTTIAQYREAGEAPVRMKLEYMKPGDTRIAFQSVSLLKQFFTEKTIHRVLDEFGQEQIRAFTREDRKKAAEPTSAKFNVRVGVPSTVPLSRVRRQQQMMELAQAGAFSSQTDPDAREALLENVDFPGKQKVLAKIRTEKKRAEALKLMNDEVARLTLIAQGMQVQMQIAQLQQAAMGDGAPDPLASENPEEIEAAMEQMSPEEIQALTAQRQ